MKFSVLASAALASTAAAFPTFNIIKSRQGWGSASKELDSYSSGTWGSYDSYGSGKAASASASATYGGSKPTATGSGTSPKSTGSGSSSSGSSSGAAGSTSGSVSDECDIGYATQNGGTTGGSAGSTTTVTSLEELSSAAGADGAAIVVVSGTLTGSEVVDVASDKTIIGATGSSLEGVGLRVKEQSNVILRNLKISKVLAEAGDAITIQASTNVWVDHVDLSSDQDHDKDYYDGLCDVTHGSAYVTISNSYIHDHWKASLVGHSDSNADEDTGKLIVTYANNYWKNINSRGPSFRFGTGHIYNNYYDTMSTAVNTRMGAQLLVESSAFTGVEKAIESADSDTVGYATVNDVDLGSTGANSAEAGTLTAADIPYEYSLLGSEAVAASVMSTAGQTLDISA